MKKIIELKIIQIEAFASYDERKLHFWVHSHRKIQIYDCNLSRAISERKYLYRNILSINL